jgi:hypothetical protein
MGPQGGGLAELGQVPRFCQPGIVVLMAYAPGIVPKVRSVDYR